VDAQGASTWERRPVKVRQNPRWIDTERAIENNEGHAFVNRARTALPRRAEMNPKLS
jgi:hypothetical protein